MVKLLFLFGMGLWSFKRGRHIFEFVLGFPLSGVHAEAIGGLTAGSVVIGFGVLLLLVHGFIKILVSFHNPYLF